MRDLIRGGRGALLRLWTGWGTALICNGQAYPCALTEAYASSFTRADRTRCIIITGTMVWAPATVVVAGVVAGGGVIMIFFWGGGGGGWEGRMR